MPTKIVVSPRFPPAMLDIARSFVPAGFELVVVDAGTPEFAAALPDAAYYVGFPRPELNSEFFKTASKLKLVQLISAGYDRLDLGRPSGRECRWPTTAAPTRWRWPSTP